jgi:hypothetical protein
MTERERAAVTAWLVVLWLGAFYLLLWAIRGASPVGVLGCWPCTG